MQEPRRPHRDLCDAGRGAGRGRRRSRLAAAWPASGHRELRLAHDLDSSRRWGLFNFPPDEAEALRALVGPEISLDGLTCNPPRRIEWWPVLLREQLDGERIKATGVRGYAAEEGDLVLAVNWSQGRAYYWVRE